VHLGGQLSDLSDGPATRLPDSWRQGQQVRPHHATDRGIVAAAGVLVGVQGLALQNAGVGWGVLGTGASGMRQVGDCMQVNAHPVPYW